MIDTHKHTHTLHNHHPQRFVFFFRLLFLLFSLQIVRVIFEMFTLLFTCCDGAGSLFTPIKKKREEKKRELYVRKNALMQIVKLSEADAKQKQNIEKSNPELSEFIYVVSRNTNNDILNTSENNLIYRSIIIHV